MGEKIKLILRKFCKIFLVGIFCQSIDYLLTFFIYNIVIIFLGNLTGYSLGSIVSYILHAKFTLNIPQKLSSIKQILYF